MSKAEAKNILVIGCRGQVGQELLARAPARGFAVSGMGLPEIDITNPASVSQAVEACSPDLLINAAAYTAVDKAENEPDLARAVNTLGPKNLAHVAAEADIPLFHISTDYVFDGAKHLPYLEDDPIAPLGVYGVTKAEGDEAVSDALQKHIILRTAWVYSPFGGNFVKTMLRLSDTHDELRVVDDQHGCPTAASDIADALLTIAGSYFSAPTAMERRWGTYHFCNGPTTTWCGFAKAIIEGKTARGGRSVPVHAITTADYPTPARRPASSVLGCDKIEKAFGIKPRVWQDALEETLDRLTAFSESM
ncbi:MAG: dTDP-4-dehydrorhamnose reductase [Rhodobiaceae bacterium]|nr:MAG: dTDP-4-dehydrorhamnose reductase [Rhodobiaceae bacterium]